jgi:lipopolysaccharide transport system permease protein
VGASTFANRDIMRSRTPDGSVRLIRPTRGWGSLRLGELVAYRELLLLLVWRDVRVRYKQTALGGAWAVVQPLLTMLVFSVIFGYLAKMPSDGIPYPIFVYTALLPWQLFAHALTESANSLVLNQQLLKKVYFPRLVIPIAAVLAGVVDFVCAFVVLLGMLVFYHITPGPAVLMLPLFVLLAVATATAVGLWLSALNVQYRDVRYLLPFLTQLWFFLTPIAYSSSLIPPTWRTWYALNPMVGVVVGFRWSLLGQSNGDPVLVLVSGVVVAVLLVGGLFYFRRMERTFADVV